MQGDEAARVVMVTGASRGIGAQCAIQAAGAGHAVCVHYRSDDAAAEAVVERIRAAGGRALATAADLAREEEVVALFARCDQALGPVTGRLLAEQIVTGTRPEVLAPFDPLR